MANGNVVIDNLVRTEDSKATRSTVMDLQMWSHAWEKAYLSMQPKPEQGLAERNMQDSSASAENNSLEPNTREQELPLEMNHGVPMPQFSLSQQGPIATPTEPSLDIALLSKPSINSTVLDGYAQGNTLLKTPAIKALPSGNASGTIDWSMVSETALQKNNMYMFLTENGQVKVWLRNQYLNEKSGLALLAKLRDTFNQIGYSLGSFAVNGKTLFQQSNRSSEQVMQRMGEDEQQLIDKKY